MNLKEHQKSHEITSNKKILQTEQTIFASGNNKTCSQYESGSKHILTCWTMNEGKCIKPDYHKSILTSCPKQNMQKMTMFSVKVFFFFDFLKKIVKIFYENCKPNKNNAFLTGLHPTLPNNLEGLTTSKVKIKFSFPPSVGTPSLQLG